MTVIVGIKNEGKVYIGGDRGASDGSSIVSMSQAKVGRNGPILYGYAGTIGIAQMIEFVNLPPCEADDPYAYIRLEVVSALKDGIESFGREGTEHDTTWIIGCQGHLYELSHSDWSVTEVEETAIGSGGSFALGSLFSTSYIHNNELPISPEVRMALALQSAIAYSPNCQGPIDVIYE